MAGMALYCSVFTRGYGLLGQPAATAKASAWACGELVEVVVEVTAADVVVVLVVVVIWVAGPLVWDTVIEMVCPYVMRDRVFTCTPSECAPSATVAEFHAST